MVNLDKFMEPSNLIVIAGKRRLFLLNLINEPVTLRSCLCHSYKHWSLDTRTTGSNYKLNARQIANNRKGHNREEWAAQSPGVMSYCLLMAIL